MAQAGGRSALVDAVTIAGYRAGSLIARALGPLAGPGAGALSLPASFATPARRRMVERHLRRVDPTLDGLRLRAAVQRSFVSYARYYAESFRLPTMSSASVERGFSIDGFDHVTTALDAGTGAILALPHLGGWEWAGRWMTDRGFPLSVVVEAIEPVELFDWFAHMRARLGMTIIRHGPDAGPAVLRALKRNEAVCLLCDRDLTRDGVGVDFFGERTTLPAGPAMLALRTGAPILPVAAYFTDRLDGHHTVVRPPVPASRLGRLRDDAARVTQALARELEALIAAHPEQWHLMQPNWPSDPGYGSEASGRDPRLGRRQAG